MDWLPVVWIVIIGFGVLTYVLLDGFDLGIGILFPVFKRREDRDVMMNTVAPVWDGNETWLILGGACLYGAFPKAYSLLLPILYMPIMIMLAGLVLRGIAFEFRYKAIKTKFVWDIAFTTGSITVAFTQGVMLGTFVQGFTLTDGLISASFFHWFTPFSFAVGLAVVVGYGLLGATWLIYKTTGDLQKRLFPVARALLFGVFAFIAYVSVFTPYVDPSITTRWFSFPNILLLAPFPLMTLFVGYKTWRAIVNREELSPFLWSMSLFAFPFIGFCISVWPNIIPHTVSIWEASSSRSSQLFLLVGIVILLPVLIAYTAYAYSVFHGKVTIESESHYS